MTSVVRRVLFTFVVRNVGTAVLAGRRGHRRRPRPLHAAAATRATAIRPLLTPAQEAVREGLLDLGGERPTFRRELARELHHRLTRRH